MKENNTTFADGLTEVCTRPTFPVKLWLLQREVTDLCLTWQTLGHDAKTDPGNSFIGVIRTGHKVE
jgi:hypothetical protein